MMLRVCDICGDDYVLGEPHDCRFRLIGQREAALSQLLRVRADNAALLVKRDRYRAALEEIVAGSIPALWGEDYSTPVQHCNACDASWPFGDRPAHTDNCPYAIAHRALHSEETE